MQLAELPVGKRRQYMQKDQREQLARCIELMQSDVAEFEAKYQGRFAEEPHVGLGNRKTRCVNEATLPIITCHPSCLEKCAGTCYVINICTKPRPNCRRVEARNTVLRRIDPNAYYGEAEARRLGFDVTHVVWDGSGNCPYQKSLARSAQRGLTRRRQTSAPSARRRRRSPFGTAGTARSTNADAAARETSASM